MVGIDKQDANAGQHIGILRRPLSLSAASTIYNMWPVDDDGLCVVDKQCFFKRPLKVGAHYHLCQTISVCLHFHMKQNKLQEKVKVIGTGRTYMNLNCTGRFLLEIV